MTALDQTARFTADDRYELAARAESQQRRNHPTHLVVLGILVLIGAGLAAGLAWRSDAGAHKKLSNRVFQLNSIKGEIEMNRALQSQSSSTQRDAEFDPIPDMRSRQASIASSVGLESSLGLPRTSNQQQGNAVLNNYTYTVRDPSLGNILAWVQAATEQIPGLAVSSIDIKPTNQNWTVQVTLYRYERIE